jgi:hypothetical protein
MKKTSKKTKRQAKTNDLPTPPETKAGYINCQLPEDEVNYLTQLLGACAETYANILVDANMAEGMTPQMLEAIQARVNLCALFKKKFSKFAEIGEPDSREVH